MSLEYEIVNHLKAHPKKSSKEIAKAIKTHHYKVILIIARLQWQQRIELAGYSKESHEHHQRPLYSITTKPHEKQRQLT